ncbi:TPR-like protein [Histomonas meleagridis]|uniref:TPR-like protein n=1 Tax=Histomonas meleagridis TaxID=135588 RepID=UPI003559B10B|nr:TPR-like protein [Histomonas meleagridis]KAH0800771.1 TPR-like protein [Histomonas meleagridis]
MSIPGTSELPAQCLEIEKDPVEFMNKITIQFMKSIFKEETEESRDNALCLGFASFLIFITENFTGPSLASKIKEGPRILLSAFVPKDFKEDFLLNGENIVTHALLPELVWLPYKLFQQYKAPSIWIGRVALILQKCLTGPSEILQKLCFDNLEGLELIIAMRTYHQFTKYLAELEKYRQSISFEFNLTGSMGKKTKFQQESKAQLILKITNCTSLREKNASNTHAVTSELNPRMVKLEDDTHILENPNLEESNEIPPLTDLELCYLLLESIAIDDRAASETKDEKRFPFLQTILQSNAPYSVVTCALYDKSRLERKNHYTQQRAVLQLESIVEDFHKEVQTESRLQCFFIIDHPPIWDIRREMGIQMLFIGAARSASKIFIEHKMWDEFVMSCAVTKEPEMAIDVLTKEEQTPQIICLLGEIKGDKDLLEKAWEASGKRMSRAQRSLAKCYLQEEKWEDAAKSFDTALKLNRLYPDAWFSLGCCQMNLEQYNESVIAFQNVVNLREDDSDAYSNLALSLMKTNKMLEAHKAISQAVRFKRNSVKLWENFIVISLNNDKMNDVLLGLEEIMKTDNKWCNTQLLYEILQVIIEEKGDANRFLQIMDEISQSADCGFDFWSIYADIMETIKNYDRALELRQNVIKTLEKDGKVTEEKQFQRIVDAAEKLAKTSEYVPDKKKGAIQRIRVLVKKYNDDFGTLPSYERLKDLLQKQ